MRWDYPLLDINPVFPVLWELLLLLLSFLSLLLLLLLSSFFWVDFCCFKQDWKWCHWSTPFGNKSYTQNSVVIVRIHHFHSKVLTCEFWELCFFLWICACSENMIFFGQLASNFYQTTVCIVEESSLHCLQ